jgi:hypothetical protein
MDSWNLNISLMVFPIMVNTLTGLEEVITDQDFVLYPNPATSFVSILERERGSISHFELTDLRGMRVREKTVNNGLLEGIDLNGLSSGVYQVAVHLKNGQVHRRKLVKE